MWKDGEIRELTSSHFVVRFQKVDMFTCYYCIACVKDRRTVLAGIMKYSTETGVNNVYGYEEDFGSAKGDPALFPILIQHLAALVGDWKDALDKIFKPERIGHQAKRLKAA